MTCPTCQHALRFVPDGCGTDRGWQDASYWECAECGEVEEMEAAA